VLTRLYDLQDTHFPDEETPQTTTEIGLKLVKQLKNSKDKTCVTLLPDADQRQKGKANAKTPLDRGRNVAGHFLELPDEVGAHSAITQSQVKGRISDHQ
jgi:hypothetical protein